MDNETKKRASRLLVKLKKIQYGLKHNKLEDFTPEWYTPQRRRMVLRLLADLHDLTAEGLENPVIDILIASLIKLEKIWGKFDANRLFTPAALQRILVHTPSGPIEIKSINQAIDQTIAQLSFLSSREEIVLQYIGRRIKNNLMLKYGTKENIIKSCKPIYINSPGHSEFKDVYDLYGTIFTLPSERESKEGFEELLGYNRQTPQKFTKYKPFEETWIALRQHASDAQTPGKPIILGAVNFDTFRFPAELQQQFQIGGTNHIIYLFVHPHYRMLRVATTLLQLMEEYSVKIAGGPVHLICEQNAPLQMKIQEYLQDNANANIDQCDRLVWWHNLGFRPLKYHYIQPPLAKGMDPCTGLTLNIKPYGGLPAIPSRIIKEHITRFFDISVLKGKVKIEREPSVVEQFEYLDHHEAVDLDKIDFGALKSSISRVFSLQKLHARNKGKLLDELVKQN